MFWGKLRFSDNVVLRTLSLLKHNAFAAVDLKYDINVYKASIWNSFASSVLTLF